MSSKTLTFYTSLSSATKRLRSPIQKHQGPACRRDGGISAPYRMAASSSQSLSVNYGEGFAAMEFEINGVCQPAAIFSPEVETGKLVKYTGSVWSADTLYASGQRLGHFAIQSDAPNPVEIVLGSYSPGEQDAQKPYIPVVFLGPLNPGCEFHCTKPVYLQAYTTVNHRRETSTRV
ncbi:hypothetical protein B0H13DRAFT_1922641 [Mycena leptocephala]|nr:hypothetical protein B0H13DRAFT_1922641 [Mycena leptocephala]